MGTVLEFPDNARRVTCHDGSCRHVLGYNGTGAHRGAGSNRDTRQDNGSISDPHTVFDHNWLTDPLPAVVRDVMEVRIEDGNVRPDQAVLTDHYRAGCRYVCAVINESAVANLQPSAWVCHEHGARVVRLNLYPFADDHLASVRDMD